MRPHVFGGRRTTNDGGRRDAGSDAPRAAGVRTLMTVKTLLQSVLDDENLTRGLGDEEARLLVEWLVERVETSHDRLSGSATLAAETQRLCRRARAVSRFVCLWCHQASHGAACQLAASERFRFPLPLPDVDPYELMQVILECEETDHLQRLETLAG